MACQVLSFISARAFSLVQGTFLVLRYTEHALIKFWRLCAPHVKWCDSNPTVGTSLAFMGGKTRTVIFNRRYKYPFEQIYLFTFKLKSSCAHILSPVKSSAKLTSLFSIKSLSEELFLTSVSFLLSNSYFLSSKFLFLSFLSFFRPSLSLLAVSRDG